MIASLHNTQPTAKQMYLDPRTKILLCVTVSSALLAGNNAGMFGYVQICLAIIPLLFLMIMKKPLIVVYYSAMYIFSATVPDLLYPHLPVSLNLLFTGMIAMFTKILPGMSMFCFLLLSTTASEFVAAMDRLHISKKFTVPASVIFRFFPTIGKEYAAISDAMKMRNVGTLRNPAKMLEYRLVPLLLSLTSIGNNLSASALTRGLDAPVLRTNICPIGFHLQDVAAILFCTAVIFLFLLTTIFGL